MADPSVAAATALAVVLHDHHCHCLRHQRHADEVSRTHVPRENHPPIVERRCL